MEGVPVAQETEVVAKAQRRRFAAAEKLRVLREADRCTKPGEVSALLRRELAGLAPRVRGPKPKPIDPRDKKLVEQTREIARPRAVPPGLPQPKAVPSAVWINPPAKLAVVDAAENTVAPESETVSSRDPGAIVELGRTLS